MPLALLVCYKYFGIKCQLNVCNIIKEIDLLSHKKQILLVNNRKMIIKIIRLEYNLNWLEDILCS